MPSERVLVDTSVWVNFFQGDKATEERLRWLMDSRRIVICGVVKQEVLQGSRNRAAFGRLQDEMAIWEYEAEQPADFVAAAELFAELRWKGKTIPPSDCLIASVARRLQLELFADDERFRQVPGLTLWEPV